MVVKVEREGYGVSLKWGEAVELVKQIDLIKPTPPLKLQQLRTELQKTMFANVHLNYKP